jgi:hypothetical protein
MLLERRYVTADWLMPIINEEYKQGSSGSYTRQQKKDSDYYRFDLMTSGAFVFVLLQLTQPAENVEQSKTAFMYSSCQSGLSVVGCNPVG